MSEKTAAPETMPTKLPPLPPPPNGAPGVPPPMPAEFASIAEAQAAVEDQSNPNRDLRTPARIKVGRFDLPVVTLATAVLLEQVDSPWIVDRIDPATGKKIDVKPSIMDVATALFIFMNGDRPDIDDILMDEGKRVRSVRQMAASIQIGELPELVSAINQMFAATGQAAKEAGVDQGSSGKKAETGPGE